jgi:lysozyme
MTIEDQLLRDEGVRLHPYRDSVGKLTIGVGRNLDDDGITQEEAMMLLANDVARVESQLDETFPWTQALDEVRRGVLLNMAFNMGIAGLSGFRRTLDLVRTGDFAGAAQAMLESKWAEQVGPRAQRLSIQMGTGVWT